MAYQSANSYNGGSLAYQYPREQNATIIEFPAKHRAVESQAPNRAPQRMSFMQAISQILHVVKSTDMVQSLRYEDYRGYEYTNVDRRQSRKGAAITLGIAVLSLAIAL